MGKNIPEDAASRTLFINFESARTGFLEGGRGDVPFYGPTAMAFAGNDRRPGFSLRFIIANVRDYMATLSSSLAVLEEGLIDYQKQTAIKKP